MITFLPKTKLGKVSVILIIAFLVFILIFYSLVASGQRGGESFFSNPYLTIPFLLAVISAMASTILGIITIFRDKESSILVFFAVIVGFLIFLFVLGEILFPH